MVQTRKSIHIKHNKCPNGYVKRSGFTRKLNGKHIKGVCVKRRSSSCKSGEILRTAYTRRIRTPNGYTKGIYVAASCIRDQGKSGKLPAGASTIGPLKKGELQRFGYTYKLPEQDRQRSLKMAINELGSLNVYRKLDAVAKLTVLTNPKASATFAEDRDWIRSKYVLS
jgi:hypothetical protein